MSVFKSYLRQLLRTLDLLKKAAENNNEEEVKRIVNQLIEDTQRGIEDN